MKQIHIRKADLAHLRTLVIDRLTERRNTLEPAHVDRVFAELLGEPVPRKGQVNGPVNGQGNGHVDPAAFKELEDRQEHLEALAVDVFHQLTTAIDRLSDLFQPIRATKKMGRPRKDTHIVVAPVVRRGNARRNERAIGLKRGEAISRNRATGMVGIRRHPKKWEVNFVRDGKYRAKYFPLSTTIPELQQIRRTMLAEYDAQRSHRPRPKSALLAKALDADKPATRKRTGLHWTQRPENKERVKALAAKMSKARDAKK